MIATFKENNDILDIAERYCELQKVGSSYRAKENPIREERSSSLYFYPDTQKYYDLHKQMIRSLRGADATDVNIKNEIRYLNLILDFDERETKRIMGGEI